MRVLPSALAAIFGLTFAVSANGVKTYPRPRGLEADENPGFRHAPSKEDKKFIEEWNKSKGRGKHDIFGPSVVQGLPSYQPYAPGEYEKVDGILLAYDEYEIDVVANIAAAITHPNQSEETRVYMVVFCREEEEEVTEYFHAAGVNMDWVVWVREEHDSVWIRDYGPRFICNPEGIEQLEAMDNDQVEDSPVRRFEDEIRALQQELEQAKAALDQERQTHQKEQRLSAEAIQSNQARIAELENLRLAESEDARAERDVIRGQLEAQTRALKQLEVRRQEDKRSLALANAQVQSLELERQVSVEAIQQNQNEIAELRSEVDASSKEMADERADHEQTRAEANKAQTLLVSLNAQHDERATMLDQAEAAADEARSRLASLNMQFEGCKNKLVRRNEELTQLLAERSKELERAKSEASEETSRLVDAAKAKLDNCKRMLTESTKTFETEKALLVAQVQNLEKKLSEAKSQDQVTLRTKMSDPSEAKLKEELDRVTETLEQTQIEHAKLGDEVQIMSQLVVRDTVEVGDTRLKERIRGELVLHSSSKVQITNPLVLGISDSDNVPKIVGRVSAHASESVASITIDKKSEQHEDIQTRISGGYTLVAVPRKSWKVNRKGRGHTVTIMLVYVFGTE
ncbi:hypothetical protein THAOC_10506 [Thalassiosira oceanica]|uniref:Uncharacterized protein n=1 Tax=Thalassiosira oceanica TaxID=159749 RepID=K0SPU8_THAOC|nr:hypothetical protein THAOC_10506 [Thalassiosira oceanica]|eukprot:EJK68323.1 hypothetical protein THAOC_10506 [Thalassiosira oceanica]